MRTKLYVGNLPENYSEASLRDVFASYGGLDQVAVIKNFAFVHFTDEQEATKAVKDLDGTMLGDKKINVEVSKNKGEKGGDRGDRGRDRGGRDSGGGRDRDRGDRDRGPRRDRDHRDEPHRGGPPGGPGAGGGGPGLGPLIGGLGMGNLGGLGGPLGGPPGGPLGGLGGPLGGLGGPLGGPGGPLGALGGALGGLSAAQLNGLGAGQLAGLGGAQLGGLGILSQLAAVAEKNQQMNSVQTQQQQQQQQSGLLQQQQQQHQQQQKQQQQQQPPQQTYPNQPDTNGRGRHEAVPAATVPNTASAGITNGYVIYERYYVDPSHALLKGLPLPQLPPLTNIRPDVLPDVRQDVRPAPQQQQYNDNLRRDVYRDRSPMNIKREYDQRR